MLFSEFVDINPRVSIEKGTEYPCVMMDEVQPGEKFVSGVISKPFKSGTKFKKDDTLFARITPCLENGKIAKYTGHYGLCGFGSTEFFVFRAKDGISDSDYVYYLALSDIIRKPAEASMFGASGRQRADLSVIENIEIDPPSLPIQKKIAGILSAYDNLIENNTRRIKILEEMAQTIYQEWFVKFKFPRHEKVRMVDSPLGKIPEGWGVNKIFDITNVNYGKNLSRKYLSDDGAYLVYGAAKVIGKYDEYNCEVPTVITGCRGSCGIMKITKPKSFVTNNSFIFDFQEHEKLFYYHQLIERGLDDCIGGTAQPQITLESISSIKLFKPTNKLLEQFCDMSQPIFNQIDLLDDKNNILRQTRDLLLPKLISGEIDVEDLDIDVGELAE